MLHPCIADGSGHAADLHAQKCRARRPSMHCQLAMLLTDTNTLPPRSMTSSHSEAHLHVLSHSSWSCILSCSILWPRRGSRGQEVLQPPLLEPVVPPADLHTIHTCSLSCYGAVASASFYAQSITQGVSGAWLRNPHNQHDLPFINQPCQAWRLLLQGHPAVPKQAQQALSGHDITFRCQRACMPARQGCSQVRHVSIASTAAAPAI